ncbi:MAG: hypothetical protein ACKVT1_01235 [Dehalococcoidia bacterium]
MSNLLQTYAAALPKIGPKMTGLGRHVRALLASDMPLDAKRELAALLDRSVVGESALYVTVYPRCECESPYALHGYNQRGLRICPEFPSRVYTARVEEWGRVSQKVVTTVGVGFIVDGFQNIVELENLKFHGIGTNSTAEAAGDTALGAEATTQYSPDNTRATGTTTEASASVYRTVGTNTVDASITVAEHGIFSQAATGGGVLLDRSLTGGQALLAADALQTTYDLTISAGG